jgi:hypothetical protein
MIRDCLTNCLRDWKVRYVPTVQTIYNWHKNRKKQYTVLSLDDVGQKYKKSETIFILGSSESINEVTKEQWDHISKHDSFGMNWWPVHPFVPTFYYTNYPRQKQHRDKLEEAITRRKKDYLNTVFFVSGNRAVKRGMHPRILPGFFSATPICCFYNYSIPIKLAREETFAAKSFEKTLYYRGGLSLILDLVNQIQYKNIILMGVDLRNAMHFYDYYPEMQWQFEAGYSKPIEIKKKEKHSTMTTKGGTKLPVEQYLYAVNDMYFKPRGISLSVGSSESILAKKIPVYQF